MDHQNEARFVIFLQHNSMGSATSHRQNEVIHNLPIAQINGVSNEQPFDDSIMPLLPPSHFKIP